MANLHELQEEWDHAVEQRVELLERGATDPTVTGEQLAAAEAAERLAALRAQRAHDDADKAAAQARAAAVRQAREHHRTVLLAANQTILDRLAEAQASIGLLVDSCLEQHDSVQAARRDGFGWHSELEHGQFFIAEAAIRALRQRGLPADRFSQICGPLEHMDLTKPVTKENAWRGRQADVDCSPSARLRRELAQG